MKPGPSRDGQRRFWRAIRDSGSVAEASAASEIGLSAGHQWFRQAGGMPPLQLRPVSPGRLSPADREAIFAGLVAGWSYAAIGRAIGRPTSTITRELDVNRFNPSRPRAVPLGQRAGRFGRVPIRPNYSPHEAQQRSEARLARAKTSKLTSSPRLRAEVAARLRDHHSPEQVSRRLQQDFPDDPEMRVSHETIYRSLYVQGKGELKRELARCLRTGRAIRKPHRRLDTRQHRLPDKVSISERPPEVADRILPGHWESQ